MNLEKLAAVQSVEIDINIETDDIYDHRESKKEALQLILRLNERAFKENPLHKKIELADDYWGLYNPIRGSSEAIDFSFMDGLGFHKHTNISVLKSVLKCWVLDRLINDRLTATTVQTYYKHVKDAIIKTHIFLQGEANAYSKYVQDLPIADAPKHQILSSVLNFLSYFNDIDSKGYYIEMLHRLLNSLKLESNSRIIPSGPNILKFSVILDNFYQTEEHSSKEYLHYFPLLLWWKITTIIPLRPFEFCGIDPECLVYESNKCYLKLPRLKDNIVYKRNLRRKQIIDKFQIPTRIEELIKEYIALVEGFGHENRKTFISRKVYSLTLPTGEREGRLKRTNDAFLSPDLQCLLERFYSNIVNDKYGFSYTNLPPVGKKPKDVVNSDILSDLIKIRPIDSRHIAFINMLAQGWSKPEIARFGGHLLLETQANYQNHQEYWIEVETRKLMQKFKLGQKAPSVKDDSTINKDSYSLSVRLDAAFKKKFILRPPATKTKKKLKIGYCTDPLQLCKTHCFHCDYWRVTSKEFETRGVELRSFISECDHTIVGLHSFLKDLNRIVFEEDLNPEIAEKILSTQKKLDDEIFKRASLIYNMERSLVT
jgi:hypothetical protein